MFAGEAQVVDNGGREKTGFMTYFMALSQQYAILGAGQHKVSAAGISVVLVEDISPISVCSGQQPAGKTPRNLRHQKLIYGYA